MTRARWYRPRRAALLWGAARWLLAGAAPVFLALLGAGGAYAWLSGRIVSRDRQALEIARRDSVIAVLRAEAAAAETAYVVVRDTVRQTATRHHVALGLVDIDAQPPAVRLALLTADTAVRQCTRALSACDRALAAKQAVIDTQAAQIRALKAPDPRLVPQLGAGWDFLHQEVVGRAALDVRTVRDFHVLGAVDASRTHSRLVLLANVAF